MATGATDTETAESPAPQPADVIADIFNVHAKGDGASVANGSYATFWFGHRYEAAGTRYYTAFVQQTPEKYGDATDDFPDPSAKANLTEATYAETSTASTPWTLVGVQPHVGYLGSAEKVDAVDTARKVMEFKASDGRLLLAVPTSALVNEGVTAYGYEMLVRSVDKAWSYAGRVDAGADNASGCGTDAGEHAPPCIRSTGTFRFVKRTDPLPDLEFVPSGTEIGAGGRAHPVPSAHAVRYRYDSGSASYRSIGH
jgi:hypothetical protein